MDNENGQICLASCKPRGIRTARKYVNLRREQKWHDKDYKKAHLPSRWVKPFQGASHAKGIVLEKVHRIDDNLAWIRQYKHAAPLVQFEALLDIGIKLFSD